MEPKKNRNADLERFKPQFLQLGIIVGISLTLIAFEWNRDSRDFSYQLDGKDDKYIDEVEIYSLPPEAVKPPPPITMPEFITIIEDNIPIHAPITWDDWIGIDDPIERFVFSEPELAPEGPIEIIAQEMPLFRGGDLGSFHEWVQSRVNYPAAASTNRIEGRVFVSFVVEMDGSVSNVEILKSPHHSLEEEVARVISGSPKWSPGRQMGVPVRIRFSMSVNFVLK